NRLMRLEHNFDAMLSFNLKKQGGSHREQDEIFDFGKQVVRSVTGTNAYDTDEPLAEGKRSYRHKTSELSNYASILEKMVEPSPLKRSVVFTEIVVELKKLSMRV
ncbi:MAG: ferredoxin-nitrite reductase, partial [Planctomycetota bacterium]|nr:ferredoxin-nitrite reductase [Planctomycetota bacterium]